MPRVNVGDCEIYYEEHGQGDVVVLLHGLGSSVLDWEYQIPALAARYRVIAIDIRGHGRSDKPKGPYAVAMFAADVAKVMEKLELGPTHIIGISMGGMIAFQLAVDKPTLCRSLTIINSGPALILRTFTEKLLPWSRRIALKLVGLKGLAKKVAALNLPNPDQAELRDKLAARLGDSDPAAYRASMEALFGWTVEDRVGSIECPILVVAADQDYTPVSFKEAYLKKLRKARLSVIANSRHVTPFDQPESLNRVMLDFLAEHAKEGRS